MPLDRAAARAWLDGQESADRKNARVIDKVLVALPRELDAAERVQLVCDFAAEVGGGRIPWLAGIHDRGDDAGNPHAHVIFRDRDHETGKRVAALSEKGSTDRIRETWERMANQALERAGSDSRIDRRSLADQGIAREAGIHIGPNVLAMEERGIRPTSRREITLDGRVIDWPKIDQGRTRLDRLAEIETANDNAERNRERDSGKDGKGRGAPAAPATERKAPASGRTDPPPEALREPPGSPRNQAATNTPAREPEAPQRSPQEAERVQPAPTVAAVAADRGPEVSRLRQAIDRARERLDALSTRLDQAFNRIRERFLDQDRQRDQVGQGRPSALDAFRRRPAREEPERARSILDAYRRGQNRDRSGPER